MKYEPITFDGYDLTFWKSTYTSNGRLAVGCDCEDGPYAVVTKNLDSEELTNGRCAFMDTYNACDLVLWMERLGIIKPTYGLGFSGFCCYPEYEFDAEWLSGVTEY